MHHSKAQGSYPHDAPLRLLNLLLQKESAKAFLGVAPLQGVFTHVKLAGAGKYWPWSEGQNGFKGLLKGLHLGWRAEPEYGSCSVQNAA